jgi:hypothetical protein
MHLNIQNMHFKVNFFEKKNKNFSIGTYYNEYILFTNLFNNLQVTIK